MHCNLLTILIAIKYGVPIATQTANKLVVNKENDEKNATLSANRVKCEQLATRQYKQSNKHTHCCYHGVQDGNCRDKA